MVRSYSGTATLRGTVLGFVESALHPEGNSPISQQISHSIEKKKQKCQDARGQSLKVMPSMNPDPEPQGLNPDKELRLAMRCCRVARTCTFAKTGPASGVAQAVKEKARF
ncbi:hypothetical protein NDU88_008764 [Pleurodeles waltl]|uniref:Uncharacterized protein n=1 Tax=Pleurodeles waltl TaxID=8319 RepID=A0AAV7NF71_PLEWA|nr:hypothetical protein NDU88_008764 [Pleurodeles waltl]